MADIYRALVPKGAARARALVPAEPAQVRDADHAIELARAANEDLRPRDAVLLLQRALELDPANSVAVRELGATLLDAGHREEARELFEDFLGRYPAQSRARLAYAQLLLRGGEIPAAIAECRTCIEGEPTWPAPYPVLIRALCRTGDVPAARAMLERFRPVADDARTVALAEQMIAGAR